MPPSIGADVQPMAASTEQLFMAFVGNRDSATLERLLQPHLAQAYALAHRILGNDTDTDDAVQEALVRLVTTCDRYDGSVAFGAWLGQLVRHAAIDLRRRCGARNRRERVIDQHAIVDGGPRSGDSARVTAIRRAIADLPERYRAPIELHYFAQLSHEQTALALGLKEDAVAQRISRARERLRRSLKRGGLAMSLLALTDLLAAREAPARPALRSTGELVTDAIARAAKRAGVLVIRRRGPWLAAVAAAMSEPSQGGPTAVPAPGGGASSSVRWWTFATPETPGLTPIKGSWRHLERGGIDDGGCMVVDSDDFAAQFELPPMAAWRLSIQVYPMRPVTADGKAWLRIYPGYSDLAIFDNVGRVEVTDSARLDDSRLSEKTVFASGDSLDWWMEGNRTSLVFYQRPGESNRWVLATHGRWRIDDLRIERVRPVDLPDVGTWRDAVASIPDAERSDSRDVPGMLGLDSLRPVTISFATAAEVASWER